MICGFKQKFADGTPTYFREKILIGVDRPDVRAYVFNDKGIEVIPFGNAGTREYKVWESSENGFVHVKDLVLNPKLTTIRIGNRWKVGNKIHMATGVRTKGYHQFNKGIPELETIKVVLPIKIEWYTFHFAPLDIMGLKGGTSRDPVVTIAGHRFPSGCTQVKNLAKNDGFDSLEQFYKWFDKDFEGQLISWMDIKPDPMDWVHETLITK